MKILYVANARVPSRTANSIQVMKVCAALAALGHEVELLVPRFERTPEGTRGLEDHYGVPIAFAVRRLGGWRPLGRLAWETLAAARALGAGADLYLTRNERIGLVLARAGRPTVVELHQPPAKRLDRMALAALTGASGLRLVVTISEALRRRIAQALPALDPGRVVVEHDGVDLARFRDLPDARSARRRLGWREAPSVGYAGHLYQGRGVELILALAGAFPGLAFHLVGGEPSAVEATRSRVGDLGLSNVELHGFVPNARLPLRLAACDVLLMPYARKVVTSGGGETGGFASPLKMFEYMATGRAILASRLPGVLEVLDEENALLLEPDDVAAWTAALGRVQDPALRARLGERARADVEPYAWERRMERIVRAAGGRAPRAEHG